MPDELGEVMSGGAEPQRSQPQQHISFSGELGAMFREGLKDLQNALLPAFPDSQRGVEEPGTQLNPTQMMVTDDLLGNESRKGGFEPTKEMSLQEMLDSPAPPTPPMQSRDTGREM